VAEGSDIPPRLVWSSDCSLHVVFPPGRERCAPSVAARIAAEGLAGVQDVVPASTTVQVVFDPGLASIDEAAARVLEMACEVVGEMGVGEVLPGGARDVEIPVCYDASVAPDLAEVSAAAGLSAESFAAAHASAAYTVRFLGFAPGFAYLDGLPAPLYSPRLATPRTRVPAGSVGIAGDRTGIYPAALPGGWRLIGATPLRMFYPSRTEPSLLRAGDRVRFLAITLTEFQRLRMGEG
jgi:KipI family sensor histidine kinase inhibitor